MDSGKLVASLRSLQEAVDVEALALKKVVGDNFHPGSSTMAIEINRALMEVEEIATRLEQLSIQALALIDEANKATGGSPHHDLSADVDSQASTEPVRPIGREAAKKARSQGSSSLSGGAYVEQFAELNSHKAALVELKREQVAVMRNQEELQREREQVTMMKNAEEERIININLDNYTGVTREYYESRQLEIMHARRTRLGPQ